MVQPVKTPPRRSELFILPQDDLDPPNFPCSRPESSVSQRTLGSVLVENSCSKVFSVDRASRYMCVCT
uniref:Uncharacterized protein n=1 Tax=Pongo abelii TaxID=9601 RepID=A0A8I5U9U9_PONAB